jgi:hypothetical protein
VPANFTDDVLGTFAAAAVDQHRGPRSRKLERDVAADAIGGAGDETCLAVELHCTDCS